MKINKILLSVAFIVIFLFGILLGFNLKNTQSGGESIDLSPPDLSPSSQSCQYNGKTYKSGENFRAKDGCNTCSCNDGEVLCTGMGCSK